MELKEVWDGALSAIRELLDEGDEDRIFEDPLSVLVRSGWEIPGEDLKPAEYEILLSTGGPASRIIGDLNEYGYPSTARLQVQDWFKPWTDFHATEEEDELLLKYASYC